jgi:hypothetical protein
MYSDDDGATFTAFPGLAPRSPQCLASDGYVIVGMSTHTIAANPPCMVSVDAGQTWTLRPIAQVAMARTYRRLAFNGSFWLGVAEDTGATAVTVSNARAF